MVAYFCKYGYGGHKDMKCKSFKWKSKFDLVVLIKKYSIFATHFFFKIIKYNLDFNLKFDDGHIEITFDVYMSSKKRQPFCLVKHLCKYSDLGIRYVT